MPDYDFFRLQKRVAKELDEARFEHTLGVMYTCAALAMAHGYDIDDARCAGLLHDCAKCIPTKKKLKLCEDYYVPITDFEKSHPFLIHAKLGAALAREKYGVTDEQILSAITYHTTGRPEMTLLEKINRAYGTTILLVTHNTAIRKMAHQVLTIRDGRVTEATWNDAPVPAAELEDL